MLHNWNSIDRRRRVGKPGPYPAVFQVFYNYLELQAKGNSRQMKLQAGEMLAKGIAGRTMPCPQSIVFSS